MPTYAIGDVQGCYDELVDLLARIEFDQERDRLWFVGDLVNRGPRSLDVLDLVVGLGECATTVLGNHDLHLVAAAEGVRAPRPKDTFADVLACVRRDQLIDWLCTRPLVHEDRGLGFVMVHAGLPPAWTVDEALARAAEVQAALAGGKRARFLRRMYGDLPDRWSESLTGADRLRFVVNALTRMRFCSRDGRIDVSVSGPPHNAPAGLVPWYAAPDRRNAGARIVFGHWATLQIEVPLAPEHGVFHVDDGCAWGRTLRALRLDDLRSFSVPSRQPALF